jgi:archaellum component FlaC
MQDQINGIQSQSSSMQKDISDLKKAVLRIENDHGNKLNALFDGYKQNSERLFRIEEQVSRQEEFILKRVK